MSTQWEYYKRKYMDCDFDVLGVEGWELAFVVADPSHTGYGQYMCLFKRPRLAPTEPTKPVGAFGDGLVERLDRVAYEAYRSTGESFSMVARAILTELAAMPVELDSNDLFGELLKAYAHGTSGVSDGRGIIVQREVLRARLAPILAAKDARLSDLEIRNRFYVERIAELEKRLAERNSEPRLNGKTISEHLHEFLGEKPGTLTAFEALALVGDLITELREQNAPVDATGKTPGDVAYEAWRALPSVQQTERDRGRPYLEPHNLCATEKEEWAAISTAVLRAFGNGAEALRRVRERLTIEDDPTGYFRSIIDDELANITDPQKPTKPDHVHEIGSCSHCDTQNITDVKKPTKPLVKTPPGGPCAICGKSSFAHGVTSPDKNGIQHVLWCEELP